jgi:hypothetical protein
VKDITFYFDRCFGKRFPKAIEYVRPPFDVQYHDKLRFPQEMEDDKWLEKVGMEGWIVLSHDAKWHNEAAAAMAIKQFNIGCFYLHGASEQTWYKLRLFTINFRRIETICQNEVRPFIYKVTGSNRFHKIIL